MTVAEYIFYILEILGTAAFAVSGAMIAAGRRMDIFGIIFMGCTTALGGGITRDILIGKLPPQMFSDYIFLLIAAITSVVVFIIGVALKEQCKNRKKLIDDIINIFDAIGLGVFTISGAQVAIGAGFSENAFLVIFVAMLTGAGGGMLRDVMCRQIPFVLSKRIYAIASLCGACSYWVIRRYIFDVWAAFICIALVFIIRMLATRFEWDLPRIK